MLIHVALYLTLNQKCVPGDPAFLSHLYVTDVFSYNILQNDNGLNIAIFNKIQNNLNHNF